MHFRAFLGKGSKKSHWALQNMFMFTKSPCRKLSPTKPTKFSILVFFLDLFLFYRVFGYFSAMGVKKHYKKRFTKNHVGQFLQTKESRQKNPKPIFLDFVYHLFGPFLAREFQQHHKIISKK
jgi:hypothetical protein